jgi:hypothetical protein
MPIEDYLDRRRFELLVAMAEAVERRVGTSAVRPEEIGETLGLTDDEIQQYTTYWTNKGCLKSLTLHKVVITADAIDTIDRAEAKRQFARLREKYVESGCPDHECWSFSADPARGIRVFKRLEAQGLIEPMGSNTATWRLTNLGHQLVIEPNSVGPSISIRVHQAEVAVGNAATATNTEDGSSRVTQEQLRAATRDAQIALVDDQDALAQMDARLYEALNQFLRIARDIQVDQKSLVGVQAEMRVILDETLARHASGETRARALPKTLKVVEALLESPILAGIAKQLMSRGS